MVKCAGWAKVRGDWESVVGFGRKGLDERGVWVFTILGNSEQIWRFARTVWRFA